MSIFLKDIQIAKDEYWSFEEKEKINSGFCEENIWSSLDVFKVLKNLKVIK